MPFYEQEPIKRETINPSTNTIVPVIASYNAEGDCMPLYFRYSNPDGTYHDVAVTRVISKKPNSTFGTIYFCEAAVNGRCIPIALYFHRSENKWSLRTV